MSVAHAMLVEEATTTAAAVEGAALEATPAQPEVIGEKERAEKAKEKEEGKGADKPEKPEKK